MEEKDIDRTLDESLELLDKLKNDTKPKPPDVLIVDDVKANIYLMETILQDFFTFESVQTSEAMWRKLLRYTPRLILLDLMMPYEDGFTVLEKLREKNDYKSIPVIVVSAKDEREDVVRALKLGAKDYIVKPVKEKVLIDKISTILNPNNDDLFNFDD